MTGELLRGVDWAFCSFRATRIRPSGLRVSEAITPSCGAIFFKCFVGTAALGPFDPLPREKQPRPRRRKLGPVLRLVLGRGTKC
ncbi:unnamed protein product [Protopolystoma xenopodis]|uniref:Uncharacterized protein n=1 Tax=Protopolystoma xenopodis TaxID=117903 RepID=A0A448X250_9PLAT|nr:unnamed protein product [Protopolystoma xenopodis]